VRHFTDAIGRALQVYRDHESWALLRARGMREDNSWDHAAQQYGDVYDWALRLVR
jgi:starch synthase